MKKSFGFTLIEVLIVMVIISIVASVAVITLHTNQRKTYETLANELVNAILLAEEEAMLRPAVVGLGFTSNTFQFFTVQRDAKTNQNKWMPIQKPALKAHPLPANTQIILKIHGETVAINGQPQLIITPSNDLTPFVILIGKHDENPYYQVIGKANGEVVSEAIKAE